MVSEKAQPSGTQDTKGIPILATLVAEGFVCSFRLPNVNAEAGNNGRDNAEIASNTEGYQEDGEAHSQDVASD